MTYYCSPTAPPSNSKCADVDSACQLFRVLQLIDTDDTVIFLPGTYAINASLLDKVLHFNSPTTFISQNGSASTIIDFSEARGGFSIDSAPFTIRGFTIINFSSQPANGT